ncbi:bcl-2-like protein 1 isoform 1-T1 [Morphnus guianensis]
MGPSFPAVCVARGPEHLSSQWSKVPGYPGEQEGLCHAVGVLHGCRVQMCSLRACFREQFSSGGLLSFSLPFTSPSPGHGHLSPALSHTSLGGRGAVAVRHAVALLKFARLLLLLEMKDWRQPAWTSRAGVTAFLARPRAWPALPKPGERPEFHDPERLPSPQGFAKSRLCCRVTCDGQDAGVLVLLGCGSGERKERFVDLYGNDAAAEVRKGQETFNKWLLTGATVAGVLLLGSLLSRK